MSWRHPRRPSTDERSKSRLEISIDSMKCDDPDIQQALKAAQDRIKWPGGPTLEESRELLSLYLAGGGDPARRHPELIYVSICGVYSTRANGHRPVMHDVPCGFVLRCKLYLHFHGQYGRACIHFAVLEGQSCFVEALLELECGSVQAAIQDSNGSTALHLAVRQYPKGGDLRNTELLLSAGADPSVLDHGGRSPIWFAIASKRTYITRLLLEACPDPNPIVSPSSTALQLAVMHDAVSDTEYILANGADPDGKSADGQPLLHTAVRASSRPCQLALLQAGADPGQLTKSGWTCYDSALVMSKPTMAQLMSGSGVYGLQKGPYELPSSIARIKAAAIDCPGQCFDSFVASANGTKQDGELLSPVQRATMSKHSRCVKALLEYGVPGDETTDYGQSLVHLATGSVGTIQELIKAGCSVHGNDRGGSTPLHDAAGKGCMASCALLVEAGCDRCATDNDGLRPDQIASRRGYHFVARRIWTVPSPRQVAVMRWKVAQQAKVDSKLLFISAAYGRPMELRKRMHHGKLAGGLTARRPLQTGEGVRMVTPLEAARLGGHDECVKLLEDAMGR